jgi:DNA replication and checkpoint protein
MEDKEREALTEKSNALRAELKIWEKEFASANNGLKASRDDIKKNPEIGILSSFPPVAGVDGAFSQQIQRV